MSFQDLDDEEEENVEHLRGDMEFWTDGDYCRFGFNVMNGTCIEINLTEMDDFADTVDECETDHYRFKGRIGSNKYLFEGDHPAVHIYHQHTHVASFTDYEKYPIRSIQQIVNDVAVNWDVEKLAKKEVEKYVYDNDEIDVRDTYGEVATVTVTSDRYRLNQHIKLCLMDSLRTQFDPTGVKIKSKEKFAQLTDQFLDNVSVTISDKAVYKLDIDTSKF